MPHVTDLTADHIIEGATPRITYTLKDAAGAVITGALDTQLATIYDLATGDVVGIWDDLDINGAQGNTVTLGIGAWDLPTSATAKLDTSKEMETHRIAMKFTYESGKVGRHWMDIRIYRQPQGT